MRRVGGPEATALQVALPRPPAAVPSSDPTRWPRRDGRDEIAAELDLGETTVKTHVCSLYAKLGTRSRVLVAHAGWQAGIVPVG